MPPKSKKMAKPASPEHSSENEIDQESEKESTGWSQDGDDPMEAESVDNENDDTNSDLEVFIGNAMTDHSRRHSCHGGLRSSERLQMHSILKS